MDKNTLKVLDALSPQTTVLGVPRSKFWPIIGPVILICVFIILKNPILSVLVLLTSIGGLVSLYRNDSQGFDITRLNINHRRGCYDPFENRTIHVAVTGADHDY